MDPVDDSSSRPVEPHYTVTNVEPYGYLVWRVSVVCPDGTTRVLFLANGTEVMSKIRLSVAACALLWETKVGATPLGAL